MSREMYCILAIMIRSAVIAWNLKNIIKNVWIAIADTEEVLLMSGRYGRCFILEQYNKFIFHLLLSPDN